MTRDEQIVQIKHYLGRVKDAQDYVSHAVDKGDFSEAAAWAQQMREDMSWLVTLLEERNHEDAKPRKDPDGDVDDYDASSGDQG